MVLCQSLSPVWYILEEEFFDLLKRRDIADFRRGKRKMQVHLFFLMNILFVLTLAIVRGIFGLPLPPFSSFMHPYEYLYLCRTFRRSWLRKLYVHKAQLSLTFESRIRKSESRAYDYPRLSHPHSALHVSFLCLFLPQDSEIRRIKIMKATRNSHWFHSLSRFSIELLITKCLIDNFDTYVGLCSDGHPNFLLLKANQYVSAFT